jgi:hypothetical protein
MARTSNGFKMILLLTAFFAVSGCGSAGNVGSGGATQTISGLASSGAALTGAVSLKDSKGVVRTAQIDNQGGYFLDITGLTAPFILNAGNFYSFAASGGRVNINPLSNLAFFLAADYPGNLDALYADNQNIGGNLAFIAGRLTTIVAVLEDSFYLAGLYPSNVTKDQRDFLNGLYLLDQGVDKLLSVVTVSLVSNSQITLTQTHKSIPFITIALPHGSTQPAVSVNPVMLALLILTTGH